jgi:hypothetical protein
VLRGDGKGGEMKTDMSELSRFVRTLEDLYNYSDYSLFVGEVEELVKYTHNLDYLCGVMHVTVAVGRALKYGLDREQRILEQSQPVPISQESRGGRWVKE